MPGDPAEWSWPTRRIILLVRRGLDTAGNWCNTSPSRSHSRTFLYSPCGCVPLCAGRFRRRSGLRMPGQVRKVLHIRLFQRLTSDISRLLSRGVILPRVGNQAHFYSYGLHHRTTALNRDRFYSFILRGRPAPGTPLPTPGCSLTGLPDRSARRKTSRRRLRCAWPYSLP